MSEVGSLFGLGSPSGNQKESLRRAKWRWCELPYIRRTSSSSECQAATPTATLSYTTLIASHPTPPTPPKASHPLPPHLIPLHPTYTHPTTAPYPTQPRHESLYPTQHTPPSPAHLKALLSTHCVLLTYHLPRTARSPYLSSVRCGFGRHSHWARCTGRF